MIRLVDYCVSFFLHNVYIIVRPIWISELLPLYYMQIPILHCFILLSAYNIQYNTNGATKRGDVELQTMEVKEVLTIFHLDQTFNTDFHKQYLIPGSYKLLRILDKTNFTQIYEVVSTTSAASVAGLIRIHKLSLNPTFTILYLIYPDKPNFILRKWQVMLYVVNGIGYCYTEIYFYKLTKFHCQTPMRSST